MPKIDAFITGIRQKWHASRFASAFLVTIMAFGLFRPHVVHCFCSGGLITCSHKADHMAVGEHCVQESSILYSVIVLDAMS